MIRKKKNLRQKLIPAFVAAACIPIVIFALISQYRLRQSTWENLESQNVAELKKADQSLDMILDKYETVLYDISTDEEFLQLVMDVKDENDILETDAYLLRREFAHICNRNEGVTGIQLILPENRRIFYDRLASSSVNTTWMDSVEQPKETDSQIVSYFIESAEGSGQQKDTSEKRMFHIARRLVDYWDIHREVGVVILSVDLEQLQKVLSSDTTSDIYLMEDGKVAGAKEEDYFGLTEEKLKTDRVKCLEEKNEKSGWSLLLCQPVKEYKKAVKEQMGFWILVATVAIGLFLLMIDRITKPVMNSVNEIVDAMESLENDNFKLRLPMNEEDSEEIQQISNGFNEMAERIHKLIEQVKTSAVEQKNAEISALEAQIDPHFLYNILDTINWKAIENEQYEISNMLVSLAGILRYSINDAGEIATINEEWEWLKKYVYLQEQKLGDPIQLNIVGKETYGCYRIHKMLLQPLVENAVKYGFRGNEEEHQLTVHLSQAGEQLHIQVVNNGNPMSEERIQVINSGIEEKNHLGISNVKKRLKLYYGEDAVLYYERVSKGVKVHLFVPVLKGEKDENRSDRR